MEVVEASLSVDGSIEEDRQNGLRGACVVDDLPGEEEILVVVDEVVLLLDILGPLEEEDKAVDVGLHAVDQIVLFKGVYFLDLDGRGSHLLDEFGEDGGIGLDRAPLIEHDI